MKGLIGRKRKREVSLSEREIQTAAVVLLSSPSSENKYRWIKALFPQVKKIGDSAMEKRLVESIEKDAQSLSSIPAIFYGPSKARTLKAFVESLSSILESLPTNSNYRPRLKKIAREAYDNLVTDILFKGLGIPLIFLNTFYELTIRKTMFISNPPKEAIEAMGVIVAASALYGLAKIGEFIKLSIKTLPKINR